MKISIITTCKNSEATIEDTIKSVLSQNYPDLEYIVIDGKSTDRTLEIINKYRNKISLLISEADGGFYQAINKGINLASGDVIGNLNSDDFYSNSTILEQVAKTFEPGVDAVYGDLHYVDKVDTKKIIRNWKSGEYKEGAFVKGWMPPHPTFFVRKEIYKKFGLFNTDLKSAADYELMLRFIHKHKIKIAYLSEVLVKMRIGGKSNSTIHKRIKANLEDRRAWEMNGLKPALLTFLLKPLLKLSQYWK